MTNLKQSTRQRAQQIFLQYNGNKDHIDIIEQLLLNVSIHTICKQFNISESTAFRIKRKYHIM